MNTLEARAKAVAARWYAAWNARDIDAIMACYAPEIRHSSPFIKRYNNTDDLELVGIAAVRDYFDRALKRNPTLQFYPKHIAVGLVSFALVYTRMTGDLAVETFAINDNDQIVRSVSHYELV